jgi:hypothetical protein
VTTSVVVSVVVPAPPATPTPPPTRRPAIGCREGDPTRPEPSHAATVRRATSGVQAPEWVRLLPDRLNRNRRAAVSQILGPGGPLARLKSPRWQLKWQQPRRVWQPGSPSLNAGVPADWNSGLAIAGRSHDGSWTGAQQANMLVSSQPAWRGEAGSPRTRLPGTRAFASGLLFNIRNDRRDISATGDKRGR